MQIISEAQSAALVTQEIAYAAAREALIAATRSDAAIFPAVLAHGSSAQDRFSVKSGASADLAGVKIGSYWPGNDQLGLPRHNSLILLFDQTVGQISWAIEAGAVNAFRTAAVDAVAADTLARPEAEVLAMFGAGRQALFECRALAKIRPIRRILVVARDQAKGEAFVRELGGFGLNAKAVSAQHACAEADIIVTATSATHALFEGEWVRPGTHVASMGSDAKGKHELPATLYDRADLFCDLPAQSISIGEFQHFRGDVATITAIGDVLEKRASGRISADQITVFDSSGIALQDLYMARHLLTALGASTERLGEAAPALSLAAEG